MGTHTGYREHAGLPVAKEVLDSIRAEREAAFPRSRLFLLFLLCIVAPAFVHLGYLPLYGLVALYFTYLAFLIANISSTILSQVVAARMENVKLIEQVEFYGENFFRRLEEPEKNRKVRE